jgi:mannonate dehydratase
LSIRLAFGQINQLDEESALLARQLGIESVQLNTPALPGDKGYWETSDLLALKERCDGYGLRLEALENVPSHFYDKVMLGLPGWQGQLDNYCQTVRNVGEAGIPILGYHFMALGVWRTSMRTPARGGAKVSSFRTEEVEGGNQTGWPSEHTQLERTAEEMWANYARFLDAVLPVAEEAGVRMALHPDDPPVESIDGVARLFTSPAALRRGYEMAGGSPAWGLDLCLGTTSSMVGGDKAVKEAIEVFGPLGRIFYVHFRDVEGSVPAFQECFLGEGNYDPLTVMRRLIESGFEGFILDDHVPVVAGDTPYGHRARSHAIGYIQATLAAANAITAAATGTQAT